ncbi:hypothetical protein MKW94_024560 [Papaver nudicaule]|uniref:non-specific serine/threonine protein kinase n=1 Tax=Papaver nudicaule TaxID=74823 RepID=A0AA42AXX1_PAPNU|nr:hypothetical protein [Papaver nudicaule]
METPPPKEEEEEHLLLLKRIQQLEAGNAHLQEKLSNLILHKESSINPNSADSRRKSSYDNTLNPRRSIGSSTNSEQSLNILESVGQSVHVFDAYGRITYWNRAAENLYGYSASESLGRNLLELLTDVENYDEALEIIQQNTMGKSCTGTFPVKNKLGERFVVITTNTPFYDDTGDLVGILCVSVDSGPFRQESRYQSSESYSTSSQLRSFPTARVSVDSRLPLQAGVASKLSNLASRLTNKLRPQMKTGDNILGRESWRGDCKDPTLSEASTSRENISAYPSGVPYEAATVGESPENPVRDYEGESETKIGIRKKVGSRAEAWISKKRMSWQWLKREHESVFDQQMSAENYEKTRILVAENNQFGNEVSTSGSSFSFATSTSRVSGSASSSVSTSSSPFHKFDMETDYSQYDIAWEDLGIGVQIGHGSCGTVYRGLWRGSDVAVKEFSKLEYSEDFLQSFRQEVLLMKRLRHPNVLLFMGAVTSPQHLCIVMEYLPCGSLFQLLQRKTARLDWRRRALMAEDIARGMNYLHRCNPPIVHRDLKSSNLLVDKNWNVKVGGFGLSRLKHATYLATNTGRGTPQWMAPEIIRNEPSDEKCDVYSFGVVLWELASQRIPWETLNTMQVIGAVGFMDRRMEIPEDTDPYWASLIKSCWHSPWRTDLMYKLATLYSFFTFAYPI